MKNEEWEHMQAQKDSHKVTKIIKENEVSLEENNNVLDIYKKLWDLTEAKYEKLLEEKEETLNKAIEYLYHLYSNSFHIDKDCCVYCGTSITEECKEDCKLLQAMNFLK